MTERTDGKGETRHPYLRPRDAAAIVLLDRSGDGVRVLMGKRSSRHAFMPDVHVFPGGKCDADDHALPHASTLHPEVERLLRIGPPAGLGAARARALALTAWRELCEETGLTPEGGLPPLHCLRLAARAITPPGNVRRYDTRFFVTYTDEAGLNPAHMRDSDELHDLRWLDIEADSSLNIPQITRAVLEDVRTLLTNRPTLAFDAPVPFYRHRNGRELRDYLRGNADV